MSYAKVRATLDAAPDDVFAAFRVIEIAPELLAVAEAVEAYIAWQYRMPGARRFTLTDLRAALAALDAAMKETLT